MDFIYQEKELYWESDPISITELDSFRRKIKEFKKNAAINILKCYQMDNGNYLCFRPQGRRDEEARANIGSFSTALCLDVLAQYKEEILDNIKYVDTCWTGNCSERCKTTNSNCNNYNGARYVGYVIKALLDRKRPALAKMATLNKLYTYATRWDNNIYYYIELHDTAIAPDEPIAVHFNQLVIGCFEEFWIDVVTKPFNLHPFYLYRGLQFVAYFEAVIKSEIQKLNKKVLADLAETDVLFDECSKKIYELAKYELYRQMALNLSGDMTLYDVKRLIYSLLVVSHKDRFSNTLIQDKAIEMIFQTQKNSPNSLWPTGQLLPIGNDAMMPVLSIECACDLLESKAIQKRLIKWLSEIKYIYDFCARTIKSDQTNTLYGWYPPESRDKIPVSYMSAFVLSFIKMFCELLSVKLQVLAKESFKIHYRNPATEWDDILDSMSVKAKLLLMTKDYEEFCRFSEKKRHRAITSAILFGIPGTGKTSYARGLAKRMNWDYLELTPGVFFSGGETSIIENINRIFENMLHLEKTVVFIDEIDDLIRDRDIGQKSRNISFFDPRNMYVNVLLPRFQELHDKQNVILILATNHFDRVDPAIKRRGRIDLIVPVGPLCAFSRLELLYKLYSNEIEGLSESELETKLINYLRNTSYIKYKYLEIILNQKGGFNEITRHTSKKVEFKNKELERFAKQIETSDNSRPLAKDDCKDVPGYSDEFDKAFVRVCHIILTDDNRKSEEDIKSINLFMELYTTSNDNLYYTALSPMYDRLRYMYNKDNARYEEAYRKLQAYIFGREI